MVTKEIRTKENINGQYVKIYVSKCVDGDILLRIDELTSTKDSYPTIDRMAVSKLKKTDVYRLIDILNDSV